MSCPNSTFANILRAASRPSGSGAGSRDFGRQRAKLAGRSDRKNGLGEQMLLYCLELRGDAVHGHALDVLLVEHVEQVRQPGDVIQVRMRDEDVELGGLQQIAGPE